MFKNMFACAALLIASAFLTAPLHAQEQPKKAKYESYSEETKAMLRKVWTHPLYDKPVPTTLQDALASQKILLANNPYWKEKSGPGLSEVCNSLHSVKLSCDYNTRGAVSHFLSYYGKGLFPAAGGTNPYVEKHDPEYFDLDDVFIGKPRQNAMLAQAIKRNAKLFKNGDLTADAVKTSWK